MGSAKKQVDITPLVRRAQAGEKEAFGDLARIFLRPAYAIALPIVEDTADAEEIAQEALVTALQKLDQLHSPDRFAGWLMQIVRSRALNLLAHGRVKKSYVRSSGVTPAGIALEDPFVKKSLLAALQTLTNVQQEVVLLHDMENWTHPEIGAALEISVESSRQYLFQARRKLKENLEKMGIRRNHDA